MVSYWTRRGWVMIAEAFMALRNAVQSAAERRLDVFAHGFVLPRYEEKACLCVHEDCERVDHLNVQLLQVP